MLISYLLAHQYYLKQSGFREALIDGPARRVGHTMAAVLNIMH